MGGEEARTPNAITPRAPAAVLSEERSAVMNIAKLAQRFHRYQLLRELAQGGMGVVYAARLQGSHGLERLVAIKTLRPITSVSARSALLGEARLTARLHHPNVVATIDLGEVDDLPYVVMELIDGVALSRLTSSVGAAALPPNLAAWIVMQAALGLHAAHELTDGEEDKPLGLVHRDISPQNILVSLQGEVKIADFGIAKFSGREESTATGLIKGKFAYMSPEQASDVDLDRRSDIFALGIVLWETLTGQRLFASDTPARTIMRVLEHKPKPPRLVRPDVSEALSKITLRCLAKAPENRYATAGEVADAIRGALRADTSSPPVDEADLAALVKKHFAEERAALMKDLRDSATTAEEGTTKTFSAANPEPAVGDATGLSALSVSSNSYNPVPRRSVWPALLLLLVVVVAGGAVWRITLTPTAPTTTVATTAAPTPSISAAPSSSSSSAERAPPIEAPAPPSASSTSRSKPPLTIVRKPPAAVAPPTHTASALPPPSVTTTAPGAFTSIR